MDIIGQGQLLRELPVALTRSVTKESVLGTLSALASVILLHGQNGQLLQNVRVAA